MAQKKEIVPPKEPDAAVRYWMGEISEAKKREKDYRSDGQDIIDIYSGKCKDKVPFNILFSNVETLLPALFSQTPRPVVDRRFKDDDPIGKAAAKAAQRMLEFLIDTNVEGYETFEDAISNATLDGLLPGRGFTVIKYDADIQNSDDDDSVPIVNWEHVCTDSHSWNKVFIGYAKKWSKVPWIAYEEYIDEKEAERLFGEDIAGKINYTTEREDDEDEDGNYHRRRGTGTGGRDDANSQGTRKTALIYQIWDRDGGKKIRYISPAYNDGYLKVEDDPLGITGFFNCPKPLQFIRKSNDLLPVAMYKLYENQATELNIITARLGKVVSALKVRGAYDGSLGKELEKIFNGDDNTLVPMETTSVIAAEKGFDNLIWTIPIDKLVVVAQGLITAREQCKRVIYEITGISDILRGSSVASETLGAQKIKESWGTMRLKRLQKEVQRYARDVLRIMLEIAATKMNERTWAQATGLPFTTTEQRAQLEQIAQAMQMQAAQMSQTGQQPTPQQIQQFQQVQQQMAAPQWSQILELLKNDMQRAYRIDIETNSTIDVEATEDQKNIGDFMNAMGQLMAGLTPMVDKGAMPFEAAQAILLAVVRRFRFGTEVEDQFKNMKAPQKDNPEAAKAQEELAKQQADSQVAMQEMQQKSQADQAALMQKAEQEKAELQFKFQEVMAQIQIDREAEVNKLRMENQKLAADYANEQAKQASTRSIEQMKANMQRDTELKKAALQAAAQIEIARINASYQASASQLSEENEQGEQSEEIMKAMFDTQERLLAAIAAPKPAISIQRDAAGRAVKLIPQQ